MAKMHRVHSIIERPKQDDYWLNIGVAFPHGDGDGFNIMLQALPLHGQGKIVMRAYDADKDTANEAETQPKMKKARASCTRDPCRLPRRISGGFL